MDNQTRRVYLDVCALCRPFDDQSQIRIRLETEAVQLILSHVREGTLNLTVSPVHDAEIAAIDDPAERTHLQVMLQRVGHRIPLDLTQARQRAEALVQQGLGPADAAHLACSEQVGADLVTCDDRLIRQCRWVKPGICSARRWRSVTRRTCDEGSDLPPRRCDGATCFGSIDGGPWTG